MRRDAIAKSGTSTRAKLTRRKMHHLPSFPPSHHSYPEDANPDGARHQLPAAELIRSLTKKHRFPDDFDLVEVIEDLWLWWRFDLVTGRLPSGTEQKRFYCEIGRRARAMEEALEQLEDVPKQAIVAGCAYGEKPDFAALKRNLQLLRYGAFFAAQKVVPSCPGARGNPELIDLLAKLFRIYRAAFGASARKITKTDKFGGRFFDLASDILFAFGITKTNHALGKAIQKAIAAVEARDRRNSQNSRSR